MYSLACGCLVPIMFVIYLWKMFRPGGRGRKVEAPGNSGSEEVEFIGNRSHSGRSSSRRNSLRKDVGNSDNRYFNGAEEVDSYPLQRNYLGEDNQHHIVYDGETAQTNRHNTNRRYIVVDKKKIYPNDRRGLMLVINIYKWDDNLQPERVGSERDVTKLQETGPMFGYIVHTVTNPNKKEFEKTIEEFANDKRHKEADSTIVIIMSHGDQPAEHNNPRFPSKSVDVLARDNRRVSSDWITKQFDTENCPALAGKPKIVFCATCRGGDDDYGIWAKIQKDCCIKAFPQLSDLILVFPCLAGYSSYRNEIGTWFLQDFIRVLLENWNEEDLKSILEEVGELLKARQPSLKRFQIISSCDNGFTKKFFFEMVSTEEKNRLKQLQTVTHY